MDVSAYKAKGFPGNFDEAIANVGVGGIDREQSQGMIRLCPETEAYLYDGFTPTSISYRTGSRPELEAIVAQLPGETDRERVIAAMEWVYRTVVHPHNTGPLAPDRALSEEALIASGGGWCNEQMRVFIALCEVMELPARLSFLFHANEVCGHTTAEVFLEGRWAWFDPTFNLYAELPGGRLADSRELSQQYRELAHEAYREPLLIGICFSTLRGKKIGMAVQLVSGEPHEIAFDAVQRGDGGVGAHLELFPHLVVEVFQQLAARLGHGLVDLQAEFELELVEGDLDLLVLTDRNLLFDAPRKTARNLIY